MAGTPGFFNEVCGGICWGVYGQSIVRWGRPLGSIPATWKRYPARVESAKAPPTAGRISHNL